MRRYLRIYGGVGVYEGGGGGEELLVYMKGCRGCEEILVCMRGCRGLGV